MLSIKRNRKGDLILDISFNPFLTFLKFLSAVDTFISSKTFYTIPIGLGIGFGVAIVVFANPTGTIADTPKVRINSLSPQRLTIKSQNYTTTIENDESFTLLPIKWSESVVSFSDFPNKTTDQIVIGTKDKLLENINLGEIIEIVSTNNGIYNYSVFHIREISSKDINLVLNNNNAKIIILNPTNRLGTNYLVALAN